MLRRYRIMGVDQKKEDEFNFYKGDLSVTKKLARTN